MCGFLLCILVELSLWILLCLMLGLSRWILLCLMAGRSSRVCTLLGLPEHDSCLHQLSVRPGHANDGQNQLLEGKSSCIPFVSFVFASIGGPHGQRVSGLRCGPMFVHIVHVCKALGGFSGPFRFSWKPRSQRGGGLDPKAQPVLGRAPAPRREPG